MSLVNVLKMFSSIAPDLWWAYVAKKQVNSSVQSIPCNNGPASGALDVLHGIEANKSFVAKLRQGQTQEQQRKPSSLGYG